MTDAQRRTMADRIVTITAELRPGLKVGVAGNTKAEAVHIVDLVHEIAAVRGIDVTHVTFKPFGADEVAAALEAEKETMQ